MFYYHYFKYAPHVIIITGISLLVACGSISVKPVNRDYTPSGDIDVSRIPDAVPKKEPKSRYGNPDSYS